MLQNLFKLNEPFDSIDEKTLIDRLNNSEQLTDTMYRPDRWPLSLRKVSQKTFCNVSLSKTTFEKMTFNECMFVDCLFIGVVLNSVEFHRCTFENCTFYKAKFNDCYIDPKSFVFDPKYERAAANVPLQLYRALLDNAADTNQATFEAEADFRFRKWKRAQLRFDHEIGKITLPEKRWEWLKSFTYEYLCGFGYRPFRFFGWTVSGFLAVSVFNHVVLQGDLVGSNAQGGLASFADTIFYSFSILTILGFSTITPSGSFAKLVTVTEAFFAVGWLSILTSLLVKRFLK